MTIAWRTAFLAPISLTSLICAPAPLACGGNALAPSTQTSPVAAEPRWEDAFDATPELMVFVYPSALRSDRVYGPLLRRAIALVRQRSRVVAQTRALDAMEDADEVILGLRPGSSETAEDIVVVVRGVRADVDPAALVDSEGRPLWAPGPMGRVRELIRADAASPPSEAGEVPASLFELPGRTWVIAAGDARTRARSAFTRTPARSRSRAPVEPGADDALVTIRIDGAALVRRVPALRSGDLGSVGRRLDDMTFELAAGSVDGVAPADGGPLPAPDRKVKATLSYANEDAAALAESTVRQALEAIQRKKPEGLAWLPSEQITVERPPPGKRVVLTTPLPPRLIDALLHAGAPRPGAGERDPPP